MPSRRLAAIMFADIVGYTAMMQQNEAEGMTKAQAFRQVMQTQVASHQGELLEIRGDGSLSVFKSAVNAVSCAKEIQESLRENVPLRIGIHLGDIVKNDDHIFGDAVNIASRIESMGVAGAILFSSNIRNQIKNKPEFKMTSLGRFSFKNVEGDMSVYALANEGFPVPDPKEMSGKGKLIDNQSPPFRLWFRWGLAGFMASTIGALLFLAFSFGLMGEKDINVEELRQERIAVLPFENKTNDPELDILGDMAADWINRGLMEIGDAEVVAPTTTRMHQDAIGILPNDPEGRATFSDLTGAKNLIKGNFYESKGQLIFNLELLNAEDGTLRKSFDPIRGNVENKEVLIDELQNHISGYWAARDMVAKNKINPPKYEAYRLYFELIKEYPPSVATINKIIAIDSSFYLPRILFLNLNRGGFSFSDNRPHFSFLNRHVEELSGYEKAWFQFIKNYYEGDMLSAFEGLNKIRLKYPNDPMLNHEAASLAREGMSNPELTLAIYNEIPIEALKPEKMGITYSLQFRSKCFSLFYLDRGEELKPLLADFRQNRIGSHPGMELSTIAIAALVLNDTALFETSYSDWVRDAEQYPFVFLIFGSMLNNSSLISSDFRLRLRQDLFNFSQGIGNNSPFYGLFINLWPLAAQEPENVVMDLPDTPLKHFNLYWGSLTFIEAGEMEKAQHMRSQLEEMLNIDINMAASWGKGFIHYYLGVLYTQMGEPEIALEHLVIANTLGVPRYIVYFEYDRYLASLHDFQKFKDLSTPVWPKGYKSDGGK